jgi:hypothetical protein
LVGESRSVAGATARTAGTQYGFSLAGGPRAIPRRRSGRHAAAARRWSLDGALFSVGRAGPSSRGAPRLLSAPGPEPPTTGHWCRSASTPWPRAGDSPRHRRSRVPEGRTPRRLESPLPNSLFSPLIRILILLIRAPPVRARLISVAAPSPRPPPTTQTLCLSLPRPIPPSPSLPPNEGSRGSLFSPLPSFIRAPLVHLCERLNSSPSPSFPLMHYCRGPLQRIGRAPPSS